MSQGRYWIVTLFDDSEWHPRHLFKSCDEVVWILGQQEKCGTTDRLHWQFVVALETKMRLSAVKKLFLPKVPHLELTKSKKVDEYVTKEETRVEGTQFEVGNRYRNIWFINI